MRKGRRSKLEIYASIIEAVKKKKSVALPKYYFTRIYHMID